MPDIEVKHVVSCSSQDRNNPAENLLKPEGTHKWKTAAPGEKQASVILQFEKASQIHGIDIGNEGSAFVEVLVGKSTSDADYQVLLVSSSFMTPADSRSNNNRTAVRIFTSDKLNKVTQSEKWDRVKVVCTQPFNKSVTYGLSFIKFHSASSTAPAQKEGMKKLGAFFVKKDDDDDDIKVGALFANKGKMDTSPATHPPSGAAAIRVASRRAEESRPSAVRPSTSRASPDRGDNSSARDRKVTPQPVKPSPKPSPQKKHAVSDDDDNATEEESPAPRANLKRQSTSLTSVASSRSSDAPPPLKKTKTEPPKESPAKQFGRLMEKVSFVLSGFQNPYRGQLRDKAMEMGATYKPDWGKGCTHLVCAFTNTPKYKQVRGKGRIVSKQWISDCHKQRKLLPWRKYRLGDAETPDESSDDDDQDFTPARKTTPAKKTPPAATPSKKTTPGKPAATKTPASGDGDKYGGDTDSADDTDEEIRRAQQKAKQKNDSKKPSATSSSSSSSPAKTASPTKPAADLDIFNDSTDEDEPVAMDTGDKAVAKDDGADSGCPDLPDFFADKHFFFYGEFAAPERRLLTRYIAAYDGVLEDYMNDRVKFVVTASKWDKNFDQALLDNTGLVFVKPQWINACHDKEKLLPHQPYIVVP